LKKAPKGTTRGVFVVDKSGKVLAAEPGGPAATVDVVRQLVESSDEPAAEAATEEKPANGDSKEEAKPEEEEEEEGDEAADKKDE
jgi:thioredoxin-dependent peroxiredoxin